MGRAQEVLRTGVHGTPFFEEEPRESKQTQTSGRNLANDQNMGTLMRDLLSAIDRTHPRYNDLKNAVDIAFGIN